MRLWAFCDFAYKQWNLMLVELGGIEPPTSTLPVLRSPS